MILMMEKKKKKGRTLTTDEQKQDIENNAPATGEMKEEQPDRACQQGNLWWRKGEKE